MRLPSLAAAAASTLLLFSATACSDDQIAERIAEEAAEQAGGGDVDVDIDGDSVTVDTPDGSFAAGAEIPDDFPSDEVPLIDGEVINSISGGGASGQSFTITMTVETDDAPGDVVDEAVALLEAKGFESTGRQDSGGFVIEILESPDYQVSFQAGGEAGNLTATYIVSPATP